jgi:hypothetical protein
MDREEYNYNNINYLIEKTQFFEINFDRKNEIFKNLLKVKDDKLKFKFLLITKPEFI